MRTCQHAPCANPIVRRASESSGDFRKRKYCSETCYRANAAAEKDERRAQALALKETGLTWPQVAAKVGLSPSRVKELCRKRPKAMPAEGGEGGVVQDDATAAGMIAEAPYAWAMRQAASLTESELALMAPEWRQLLESAAR